MGWVGRGAGFQRLGSRMGCAFPLGKGPQDAWVGLILGPREAGQKVQAIDLSLSPLSTGDLRAPS